MNNREKVEEKKENLNFILFLKYTNKKLISKECSEYWTLLTNFSLNCICKNYDYFIKNKKINF